MDKKVIVQVPVERVINSIGFAVKFPKNPNTNNRANGINASTKTMRLIKMIFITG
jgi:hypothetical protein